MSYSDYGGYAWKGKIEKDELTLTRFKKAEDGTISGISSPKNKPLEKKTGLKLDTLLKAYDAFEVSYSEEEPEDFDWYIDHPHHCVLGSVKGLGLCNHKGAVSLLWNGKLFATHAWELEDETSDIKENILYAIKTITYPHSIGSMMLMVTAEKEIYLGIAGYGIGKHWWKDKDGYEYLYPGDILDNESRTWDWSGKKCEKDMEKHGLTKGEEYTPIGIKSDKQWYSYCDCKKKITGWAIGVIKFNQV